MRSFCVALLLGLLVLSTHAQTGDRRPARPKPVQGPAKKLNEQTEWDKANGITTAAERIAAFKKFIKTFPRSTHLAEATALLVTAEFGSANDKLVAGAIDDAADLYAAAVNDAPKPVPAEMWTEQLSRIAANLYFRGARGEALDIAKLLEAKTHAVPGQLLDIASFYLSIENGSEAKRVAEAVIKLDEKSAPAYQALGLANRMEFDLDGSATAFAKALELDPDSLAARRGLAEMKRSLGKSDEAAALYREILAKDDGNVPARTGLILSLFDAGSRSEAEAEMARSLDANPGNVILLAGAAYWYAAHGEGEKAVASAQKAIEADPRLIWSHIALARGLLVQGQPVEAEKVLLAARRFGNFPTVEYELASVRLAAGLYREAAEELAKSFSVSDGVIRAKLGGRVQKESKYFTELVGFERRASIFAPTAADSPENASQLRALLELKQALDAAEPNADAAAKAADDFTAGDDKMKVHRQLFAASQLLDKRTALPKVLDIVKAAPLALDAGLEVPDVSTAVLASEIYESRKIAAAREDYVAVPAVPRATLSAVMRGRIEEIAGWTYYQMQDAEQAALHLRRAINVLPADSTYWRSSLWRLGTTLMVSGKDAEALDAYVKSYKGSQPDSVRYNAITAVYKRINGTTDGLEALIGPDLTPVAEMLAQRTEPTPAPVVEAVTPSPAPSAEAPTPSPTPTVEITTPSPTPTIETTPSPTPTVTVVTPVVQVPTPSPAPTATVARVTIPRIVPIATPTAAAPSPSPTPEPTPTVEVSAQPSASPSPATEPVSTPKADASPTPSPERNETTSENRKELFPPVVITIPPPEATKAKMPESTPSPAEPIPSPTTDEAKPTPEPSPTQARPRVVENQPDAAEIKPCRLTVSEESVTLQVGGGDVAVVVGREDDNELDGLAATSTSAENVSVRRQVIEGMRTRALFVLHPAGTNTGIFQIVFEMSCGRREIVVRLK
jgi:tetratricopeptide (TPR) repeat protein